MFLDRVALCGALLSSLAAVAVAQQPPERLIWAVGQPHGRVMGPNDLTLLEAWVTDRNSNGVPNAAVTFLAPDDPGVGGFLRAEDGSYANRIARAVTDSRGVASAWFRFGSQPGPFLINAVADGTSEATNFSFTNQAVPVQPLLDPAAARQALIEEYEVFYENPQLHGPFLLQAGTVVRSAPAHDGVPQREYTVERESWFFYIDELPAAAWQHRVRFIFLDANTAQPDFSTARVTVEQWWPRVQLPGSTEEISLLRPLRVNADLAHLDQDPNAYREPAIDTTFRLAGVRFMPKPDPNACAIVIHGPKERALRLDADRMEDFFKDKVMIPPSNIFTVKDSSGNRQTAKRSDLQSLIAQAQMTGCKKLFFFLASHGIGSQASLAPEDGEDAESGSTSYQEIAAMLKPLGAQGVEMCIILQPCSSGNAIQPMQDQGFDGFIVTASSETGSTMMYDYGYGSFFVDQLVSCWNDPDADTNGDGFVDLEEAFECAKSTGGFLVNWGSPMSSPIVGDLAPIAVPDIYMAEPGDTFTLTINRPAGATGDLKGTLLIDNPEIATVVGDIPGVFPLTIPAGQNSTTVTITAAMRGGTTYRANLRDPINVQYLGSAFLLVGSGYTITPNPITMDVGDAVEVTITRDPALAERTGRVNIDLDTMSGSSSPVAEIDELFVTMEEGQLSAKFTVRGYQPGKVTFVASERGSTRKESLDVTVRGSQQSCLMQGNFTTMFTIRLDPAGHGPFFALATTILRLSVANGMATIFGDNPNAGRATGMFDPETCSIPRATGMGTLVGRPNVAFEYRDVMIDPEAKRIMGEYEAGTNGALPQNQSILYDFSGALILP